MSERQIEIATGLLMGDGYLATSSKNPHIQAKMITPEYLEHIDSEFDTFGNGVKLGQTAAEHVDEMHRSGFRPDASVENYNDVYRWSSRCHPDLSVFEEWYEGGEKCWPSDIELTPLTLSHWFVCDGHWAKDRSHDYITISMVNERENKDKVEDMFSSSGLPTPSRWGTGENVCYAAWTADDSRFLHDYMVSPIPGFEYKFP